MVLTLEDAKVLWEIAKSIIRQRLSAGLKLGLSC
jgi:hypothetical protein